MPSKTRTLPISYAPMHPIPSEMLAFELNADDMLEGLFSPEDRVSVIANKNVKFGLVWL